MCRKWIILLSHLHYNTKYQTSGKKTIQYPIPANTGENLLQARKRPGFNSAREGRQGRRCRECRPRRLAALKTVREVLEAPGLGRLAPLGADELRGRPGPYVDGAPVPIASLFLFLLFLSGGERGSNSFVGLAESVHGTAGMGGVLKAAGQGERGGAHGPKQGGMNTTVKRRALQPHEVAGT